MRRLTCYDSSGTFVVVVTQGVVGARRFRVNEVKGWAADDTASVSAVMRVRRPSGETAACARVATYPPRRGGALGGDRVVRAVDVARDEAWAGLDRVSVRGRELRSALCRLGESRQQLEASCTA